MVLIHFGGSLLFYFTVYVFYILYYCYKVPDLFAWQLPNFMSLDNWNNANTYHKSYMPYLALVDRYNILFCLSYYISCEFSI